MNFGQSSQAQTPLPPGWEARFDPGQNRYFFINHVTKTTSWIDPRVQQPSTTTNYGTQQAQNASGGYYNSKLFTQLRNMFPTAPEWAVKNALLQSNNDERMAVQKLEKDGYHKQGAREQAIENNIVEKLQQEFSTAEEGIIRDIVQGVSGDENRARRELENLGYKHSPAMDYPRRSLSPTRDPFQSPSRKGLTTPVGSRTSPAKSSADTSKPQQKKLGKAAQLKIKQEFCREHTEFEREDVQMALESCDFDKAKALQLLKLMKSKPKDKSSRPTSARSSPARKETPKPKSTASTSYTFDPNIYPSSTVAKPSKSSSYSKPSTSTSVASYLRNQQKRVKPTKEVQRRAASLPSFVYVSANRMKAVGPDPSLCQGPDLDLISDSYVKERGHDPDLLLPRQTIAQGPNRKLRQGADRSLARGPNPEYVQGSSVASCGAAYSRSADSSPLHRTLLTNL